MFKRKDKKITEISAADNKKMLAAEENRRRLEGDVGDIDMSKKDDKMLENINGSKKKKKKKNPVKELKIPKTVQDAIPYKKVYTNGVFESGDGIFTKAYRLTDTNFKTTTQDAQDEMYFSYGELLNYFSPDVRPQIVIFNKYVDRHKFEQETLMQMAGDEFDGMREDMNEVLLSKIDEGQNNITQEKYLVVSVKSENIEVATASFNRIDGEISSRVKLINDAPTDPMTLEERLEVLYNIYNQDKDIPFGARMNINGHEAKRFDIDWMKKLGLTTKDIIAPDSFEFKSDYFRMGDRYGRCLFIRDLPSQLQADVLTDIANVPCTALTSIHFAPLKQDEAVKMVRNQMLEITRNMADAAKRNAQQGLGTEFVSQDLHQSKQDSDKFYDDITVRDQKVFLMTITAVVFSDSLEELDKYTKIMQNNAERHLCVMAKLSTQQRRGLATCLPLGYNQVYADRMINTEAAALFIPFESQELVQAGGFYYGINATSRNLIVINRLRGQNSNGLILGMPGSGKSFAAKMEMTEVFLNNRKNEIFVIDPQAEYKPLCDELHGQVIRIAPGSDTHINPFDMDIDVDSKGGDDPITVKSNYICAICESAIGGHYGLNPIQETVIDRCVRKLYEPYLEHMQRLRENGVKVTCDREKSPTFRDFYNLLGKQPEQEAQYIRLAIEKYCVGSYNTFSYKTNVDTNNRFIVYDIRDIGTGMSEIGMQVCLNDIWNRTIQNHKRGVRTWIYIDELYVLTQSETCARFLMYIWKQFRKYGGAPTGITQNVEDLLTNRESRGIINNSGFIMMLNQSAEDRNEIGAMLHISEAQLSFIKNADSGSGLIYYGKSIVPFINKFPKNNRIYKAVTTNPNEERSETAAK